MSGFVKGAYNLGLIRHGGGLLCSARWHPVARTWKTRVCVRELRADRAVGGGTVELPKESAACSHEDMRLFEFNGKLMASYVLADLRDRSGAHCVVGYGELVRTEEGWRLVNHRVPDFGQNDWSGKEKNWVFFEYDRRLWAIYQCDRRHVVLELDDGWWSTAHRTAGPGWSFGEMRGGTGPLPFRGQWLRFFHSSVMVPAMCRGNRIGAQYHIGALLMEPMPPFKIVAVSSEPILSGNGECPPGVWHWKPGVCIPYGAVANAKGNGWTVSLGINDGLCALMHVTENDLKL